MICLKSQKPTSFKLSWIIFYTVGANKQFVLRYWDGVCMLSPDDILAHAVNIYAELQHNIKYDLLQHMDNSYQVCSPLLMPLFTPSIWYTTTWHPVLIMSCHHLSLEYSMMKQEIKQIFYLTIRNLLWMGFSINDCFWKSETSFHKKVNK